MAVLSALKSLIAEFGNMSRAGKIKTIIFAAFIVMFIAYQGLAAALTVTLFVAVILRVREKEITPEKKRAFALYMLFLAMFFLVGNQFDSLGFAFKDVEVYYTWLCGFYELFSGSYYYGDGYMEINCYGLSAISFLFFFMDFKR